MQRPRSLIKLDAPRLPRPLALLATILTLLVAFSGQLAAQPAFKSTNLTELLNQDGEIYRLEGGKGGLFLDFNVDYSFVDYVSVGEDDLECVGISGDADGKEIPIVKRSDPFNGGSFVQGYYTMGPFDASANGTYSLRVVEGKVLGVTGDPPTPLAAGEIFQFVQDIRDPMPDIIDFTLDPPLAEGAITGELGGEVVILTINYNKDVTINSLGFPNGEDLEMVRTSGNAEADIPGILLVDYDNNQDDKLPAMYYMGRLDQSMNGEYTVRLLEGTVTSEGEAPATVPARDLLSFTLNVTNPPPIVLEPNTSEWGITDVDNFNQNGSVTVYYNLSVDVDTIDENDILITGTSEGNMGYQIPIDAAFPGGFNDPLNPSYIQVDYSLGEQLKEANNGIYKVEIVADQVFDRNDPAIAIPGGLIDTFNQNVIDPFSVTVNGRIYEETGEPSLVDDGKEVDPGLDLQAQVEVFQGQGISSGYQDVNFWNSPTGSTSTGLLLPIVTAVAGDATKGSFTISGDKTKLLKAGETFEIVGSTENNGSYTVRSSEYSINLDRTTITAEEEVISSVGDGRINFIYTVEITIDDLLIPISIPAIDAETFESLLSLISSQLGENGTVEVINDSDLRINSPSEGDSSYVMINNPGDRTDLFSNLFGFSQIKQPMLGGDDFLPAYQQINLQGFDILLTKPTGLFPPITAVTAGAAMAGSFTVTGDRARVYREGDTISVAGSTGNNGTYKVQKSVYDYDTDTTIIEVEEAVVSDEVDGNIDRIFSSVITIDNELLPIEFMGSQATTYEDYIKEIRTQLGDVAKVSFADFDNVIMIETTSDGTSSNIYINDPQVKEWQNRTGVFSGLADFSSIDNPQQGTDGWVGSSISNEFFLEFDEDKGNFLFTLLEPGQYRIRANMGVKWDADTQVSEVIAPFPEWVLQTLGDPSREGAPKDHFMYLTATEEMKGQSRTLNFSYVEETEDPTPMYDEFQVLIGSQAVRLDVLKNDQGEELRITGMAPWLGPDVIPGESPTNGSREFSVITTDGEYVYYTPPSFHVGWELFYYAIEDKDGNRDFEEVEVFTTTEITNQFSANDDFATIPLTAERTKINVLANDSVEDGRSKDDLVITEITTPTAGGRVSFQGSDVTYWPPPDFLGIDTFVYTMTDNASGTDTATVSVSVNDLPHSLQREALLRLFLRLFGSSRGGGLIYAFINNHISEINYIILDQDGNEVAPKANGQLPPSRLRSGGTSDTQADLNAWMDLTEPALVAALTGEGESVMVTQEMVDKLMTVVSHLQESGSPDLKADLQVFCEMTNDFQDLVGKTFNDSLTILGLSPEEISIPNLALERINDVLSITTWDVVGVAYKLWKSNNLQPESWEEVENAEIEKAGLKTKISDAVTGDEDVFYRVTSEVE